MTTEICSECGDPIDDLPVYPARDVGPDDGGIEFIDDPDGPFCSRECRKNFDAREHPNGYTEA